MAVICIYCQGKGGFRGPKGRWVRCRCKKPTEAQKQAIRRLHSVGTEYQQKLFDDTTKKG